MAAQSQQSTSTRIDEVGRSGIYPMSGPRPAGDAPLRGQGELAHPEERERVSSVASQWPVDATLLALGRAIFGGFFLYNGVNHFLNGKMLTDYARSKHVPMPDAAVAVSGAMLVLGGLSLVTGMRPKIGSGLIAAFLLGVSPRMHDFWNLEDQQQRMSELVNFTKNMALLGGAFFAAAVPEPWPGSVDAATSTGSLAAT